MSESAGMWIPCKACGGTGNIRLASHAEREVVAPPQDVEVPPSSPHWNSDRPSELSPLKAAPSPAGPDALAELKDYPNLQMMLAGCVSGHYTEWPLMRAELKRFVSDVVLTKKKYISALRSRPADRDADILAAAVDDWIRRGLLDARSLIADCRLDYGQPFSPEEVERQLAKRRHGKNAAMSQQEGK